MATTTPFIHLLGITVLLCVLPFLPAIVELIRKTDALPLNVSPEYDGNVRHFARGMLSYIQKQIPKRQVDRVGYCLVEGHFEDGTPFHWIRGGGGAIAVTHVLQKAAAEKVTVSNRPVILPDHTTFPRELYCTESVRGGDENIYRAILAGRSIELARRSTILRWVHSEEELVAGKESALFGRASAERLIRLGDRCRFQRLHAPRIEFGECSGGWLTNHASEDHWYQFRPRGAETAARRTVVDGDLGIPANGLFEGDLVVKGQLLIGGGAKIVGSVKAYLGTHIGRGVRIEGSVVSSASIYVDEGCRIHGPVIAEQEVIVQANNQFGNAEIPTTLSAPRIRISPGTVVFGTVWAREEGQMDASSAAEGTRVREVISLASLPTVTNTESN